MATPRWTFFDPQMLTSYSFEINPGKGQQNGEVLYEKDIPIVQNPLDTAQAVIYACQDMPKIGTIQGVVLSQAQYQAFWTWFYKPYPIQLTDDLGRVQMIYFSDVNFTRERKVLFPFYHTYEVKYVVQSVVDI